jgi:hypothetical protein
VASCTTLETTSLAVLEPARLVDLAREEPRLAAMFVAGMAQRLSLRLRHAGAPWCAQVGRRPGPDSL